MTAPPLELPGRRRALAPDDDRHRRPRTGVRRAANARRARARAAGRGAARDSRSRPSASARTCSPPTTASTCSCCGSPASSPTVRAEGTLLVAGGGATNAVCLHRARAAALGGFEFACAIPGTAGGGVWMNAGAYGSDWSAIVDPCARRDRGRDRLADARRARPLVPPLEPAARPGRGRRRVPAGAARPPTRSAPRFATSSTAARRPSRRRSARSARSSRTRPERSAPGGCSSSAASRATGSVAPSSRRGTRTSSRTPAARRPPTASALMAEARRRAREAYGVELEHEVVLLGEIAACRRAATGFSRRLQGFGVAASRRRTDAVASGGRVERGSRPRARAASVVVPLPRRITGERLDLARLVPSGRSLGIALLIVVGAARRLARRARDRRVRRAHGRRRGSAPGRRAAGAQGSRADAGHEPAQARPRRVAPDGGGAADRRRAPASTAPTRTRSASSSCRSGRSRSSGRAPTRTSSPRAAG